MHASYGCTAEEIGQLHDYSLTTSASDMPITHTLIGVGGISAVTSTFITLSSSLTERARVFALPNQCNSVHIKCLYFCDPNNI